MTEQKYQVIIMPTAIKNLKEAVRYIAKDSPANAKKFALEVRNKIHKVLKSNPNICTYPRYYPLLVTQGYKRLPVHTNYTALFVIIGQIVEVHHILHNKRDWNVVVRGKALIE